jgi:tetratricopeptide (TPR) repeat protein
MAQGDKEHRMLFDLRGRRKNVVKVVYAVLAVLMGLSLFLVIGGFNLAELFQSNNASTEAAKPFEEQAERIEVKLKKDPQDPDLLLALTRAQINAGNSLVSVEPSGQQVMTVEAAQEYQKASESWDKYTEVADKPTAGVAQLVAPALLQLAEVSKTLFEARRNVEAATDAQQLVANQRPSLNSYSTLAIYSYFAGDFEAAEKAEKKAQTFTNSASEREALDKQLGEIEKRAERFQKELDKAEAQAKKAQKGGGGGGTTPGVEEGQNPLGGTFGGGLAE